MLLTLRYWLYRLGTWLVPIIPPKLGHKLAGWIGDLAYLLVPGSRRIVQANMRHVVGIEASQRRVSALAREVFRTLARNYFDLFQLPRLDLDRLTQIVTVKGRDNFDAAVGCGRGVIIVSAHFGNFDLVGQLLAAWKVEVLVPVLPLQPPALLELVTNLRRAKGVKFFPLSTGALRATLRTLQNCGVVALAADRDLQHHGMQVPFFDAEASMPTGTVDLARRTHALLLPAFGLRLEGGRYEVQVEPALDPDWTEDAEADQRRVLQQVLAILERHIGRHPGQWVVFDRIWHG